MKNRLVYVAAGIAAVGGFLFGYDTGVISGAILFIKNDFALSGTWEEIVISSALLGAFAGAAAGGIMSDRFGRKKVIITAAIVYAAASVGTAMSPTIASLLAGRLIMGAAVGVVSFIAPLYISEVSPVDIRGKLVSLNQIALVSGIVIAYLADYALAAIHGWRWMFGLAAVPATILFVGMLFVPESPRWLINHNFIDKARSILERLRASADTIDNEIHSIQTSPEKQKGSFSELLNPLIRPALIAGIGLAIFQQITGINTIIYYAPIIFQFAGFQSASAAILATVGLGIINVAVTIVAMQLMDRVGRRPLLLIGLAGMAISMGLLGLSFTLPHHSGLLGWFTALSLLIYIASFAIGVGPIFWLLISEIYPLKIRGLAMSAATMANWGANLLVAITFLTLIHVLGGPLTFWSYGIIGIGAWLFAYFFVPETKGRSLEEIEAHWHTGRHHSKKKGAQKI